MFQLRLNQIRINASEPDHSMLLYNLEIAIESIRRNKLRSLLTSLGIIFGVASVITMLSIGQGAQQEIVANMQLLGTHNVIIQPVVEQEEGEVEDEESDAVTEHRRYSPGLTLSDLESIRMRVPHVTAVTPEIIYDTHIIRTGLMRTGRLVGVNSDYLEINNFNLAAGTNFTPLQISEAMPVAIIGSGLRSRFFPGEDPVGKRIKAGMVWFTIVGVLQEKEMSSGQIENLGIRDYNMDLFAPANSVLLRFGNRTVVSERDIREAEAANRGNSNGSARQGSANYHQLDRAIVRVTDSSYSVQIAEIIARMLQRRHNDVVDFEIIVPEQLLQQEQRTRRIFNIVLASIASISLLVGGIGIMNIMLASVVERFREIGVRRAVGARQLDIQLQFLTEALVISVGGGFIGVIFGIASSRIIETVADIQAIVTLPSILISFGVAAIIGIVFGYFPAKRAAEQDPVHVLRYE